MITLISLYVLVFLTTPILGYFYVPNINQILPFKDGMAYAQYNNSFIVFGGENATNRYSSDLYRLTQLTNQGFTWESLKQVNPPPGTTNGQLVIKNNDMYLFGGVSNTTFNQIMPLQIYRYSFQSQTWTFVNASASLTVPANRQKFTATYDGNSKVYIYGGAVNSSIFLNDFWSFDLNTNQFTSLPNINISLSSHTASLLNNGKIVFIGGVGQTIQNGVLKNPLLGINQLFVYDTIANTWEQKTTTNTTIMPSTRSSHNAAVTKDNKIVVFGGDNSGSQRNRTYINSIGILDANTWSWSAPIFKGIPASRRSNAVGGIFDDKYLTIAFGASNNMYYNDINVYNIETNSWLQTFSSTGQEDFSSNLSTGVIVGVTIACVLTAIIIAFLLWKFQKYVRWLIARVHNDVWKPRTGEPLWAETTRIIFQIFLLFIFCCFLAFVIRQAINSPNVTQIIEESAAQVQVPDVRFCFDGYTNYPASDPRALGVSCATNTGYSCNQFIRPLDMSVFQPTYSDNLGPVNCFMFRAPPEFALTSTSGFNNGTSVRFTFWGDQAAFGRIHTSVYPKEMNPNVIIYHINDNIPSLISESAALNWQVAERNDLQATNVYTIEPFTYSSLAYQLADRQYLQPVGWNYVGFLPITNSTPEISSYFRQEAANPNYPTTHTDLGIIEVHPLNFVTLVERDVKMYTLVNALGFVGGIFGLLVAIQAWLFGYRPRSPWGVVQRWSVGNMKRSLLDGLQSKFKITESGVPLVHPVHHRFSLTNLNDIDGYQETEQQRINRVEERMQMLELLFKAYYVNDEVFRSLDDANRISSQNSHNIPQELRHRTVNHQDQIMVSSGSSGSLFAPKSEKMVDDLNVSLKPSYNQSEGQFMSGYPHPFTRYDTDTSTASHIPLTNRPQNPPSYQPNTTLQMDEDD